MRFPVRFSRPRTSLFWTFAGAFLLVLIVAAVLQAVVVVSVVGPLARNAEIDRAELALRTVGEELAALPAPVTDESLHGVLRQAGRRQRMRIELVLPDGRTLRPRPGPGRLGRPAGPGRPDRLDRPDRGALPEPPFDARSGPGGGERPGPETREMPISVNAPVTLADGRTATLIGRAPGLPRLPLGLPGVPQPGLLFIPIALLLAGAAGLALFRMLVRRIRTLEGLTAQVAAGNLSARAPDLGEDEIGRLGMSLNAMTAHLETATNRLRDTDHQRRQLLADISHELATPLTSIRGYAETLSNPDVPVSEQERIRYVDHIQAEARRMDAIVIDLLDLSRLESGAVSLERERLDAAALAARAVDRLRPRFVDAGLVLEFSGLREGAWVEADGRRLEQVIDNLLGNALKYVPRGGTVAVAVDAIPADRPEVVQWTVSDDGPGIADEDRGRVFDRFYRTDPSRTEDGSGLGLAIVKEIIEGHGGTVRAAPNEPRGTVFTVRIPAA